MFFSQNPYTLYAISSQLGRYAKNSSMRSNSGVCDCSFGIFWGALKSEFVCRGYRFDSCRIFRHERLKIASIGNRIGVYLLLPVVKRVYRGERDSHRVCASDLPPIEIASAITKVGQSFVSPVASLQPKGKIRKKRICGRNSCLELAKALNGRRSHRVRRGKDGGRND